MAMEVLTEFNFDSTCTSPTFLSAPTSPHRFFYSVPTSPYRSSIPFQWEQTPGTPKIQHSSATSSNYGDAEDHQDLQDIDEIDFVFDFSSQFDTRSVALPADELFDGGKIRPLKPPPKFQYQTGGTSSNKKMEYDSPKSPKSPKRFIREAFSPRKRTNNFDPFAKAMEETRKQGIIEEFKRGREKAKRSRNRESARSLSPFRVSDLLFDDPEAEPAKVSSDSFNNGTSNNNSSVWYKKWKIKDLLLFRSVSEGRANESDQMNRYNMLRRSTEVKNSSFRSTESGGGSVSSRRGPPVSAHELHYKINRAVSTEMKKRTSLPYKHGLLGCLGFQSSMSRSCASSMSRG